jgi:hypothetical protein
MSVDKHTLQGWVAGAELRLQKTRRPFAQVPLLNRIRQVAERTQGYTLTEKIDLTRAKNFRVQESSEDFLFASIHLPVLGKQGVGNDVGVAVASFDYTDANGDEHRVIAVCAYLVSGSLRKARALKQVIAIPMK